MGADLYIEPMYSNRMKRYQPKFERAVSIRDTALAEVRAYEAILSAQESVGDEKELKAAQACLEKAKANAEAAQQAVEKAHDALYRSQGYFRDSYNGTSVFWSMGLSWWKLAPEHKGEGEERSVGAEDLARLYNLVKRTKIKPVTLAVLKENHCTVDDGENSVASWQRYFKNKRRRLLRFLKRAAQKRALGAKVVFSV